MVEIAECTGKALATRVLYTIRSVKKEYTYKEINVIGIRPRTSNLTTIT